MTSCVHCAASAAPRENSSSDSTLMTARSWLPARQIGAVGLGQGDARVGLRAVADEVAEAPELLDLRLFRGADDRLERMAVAVDVGGDRDPHA